MLRRSFHDHSLSWSQTFAFFFVFVAVIVLWLVVSIVLAGGFGVIASYLVYYFAQEKCSKCGKHAF